MNLIYTLLEKYIYEKSAFFTAIVCISLLVNYLQTKVISQLTASVFDAVEKNNMSAVLDTLKYFAGTTILYLSLMMSNDFLEIHAIAPITSWFRREFLQHVLTVNNEEFVSHDALKYHSPINRISYGLYMALTHAFSSLLPNLTFVVVITAYFLYTNTTLGCIFLFMNVMSFLYFYFIKEALIAHKREVEDVANFNESYVLDLFNNFDKIILRGQIHEEIKTYNDYSDQSIHAQTKALSEIHKHTAVLNAFVYALIIFTMYYLITLKQKKQIDTKMFIAIFTIMIMYRDRFTYLLQLIPGFLEIHGRMEYANDKLKDLNKVSSNTSFVYSPVHLSFDEIVFDGVYYKYPKSEKHLFDNLQIKIRPNHNIVGITGLSGRGKSTLMKLLLRIHPCSQGSIRVDGQDITTIDPTYLRKQITYVNQSAKLFNKKIVENLMYGCNDETECAMQLKRILEYPKIKKLYAKVDLINGESGSLGEGLSGGQRQIINIISGLINPSPILVLDEPTNALDMDLKNELLSIIDSMRIYKKCIVIITHDRDVFPLLDERISL